MVDGSLQNSAFIFQKQHDVFRIEFMKGNLERSYWKANSDKGFEEPGTDEFTKPIAADTIFYKTKC